MALTRALRPRRPPTRSAVRGRLPSRLRRFRAVVGLRLTYERVFLGMFDRFHRQVDIQARAIQVVRTWKLDVRDFAHRRFPEPGKFFEWHKQLAFADEQPEPVRRNVSDFRWRNASPRRRGFHGGAPRSVSELRLSAG